MIRVIDDLPAAVVCEGKAYSIYTDFRDWMRFELMLGDEELTGRQQLALMLEWYRDERPDSLNQATEGLLWFYRTGKNRDQKQNTGDHVSNDRASVYDYAQDAFLLYAAFYQAYGIDLSAARMHWWQFRALLEGLPEDTRLVQIMGYRSADLSRMPKEQRAHYGKLKKLYALNDKRHVRGVDGMVERIKRKKARAASVT